MPGRERRRRGRGLSLPRTPSHLRKKVFSKGVRRKALCTNSLTPEHLGHRKMGKVGSGCGRGRRAGGGGFPSLGLHAMAWASAMRGAAASKSCATSSPKGGSKNFWGQLWGQMFS